VRALRGAQGDAGQPLASMFARCAPERTPHARRRRGLPARLQMGLEGIVSKRLSSIYRSGKCKDWLKFKNPDAPAVKRSFKRGAFPFGGTSMLAPSELDRSLLNQAEACRAAAERADHPEVRAAYLDLAKSWEIIAHAEQCIQEQRAA
jgi:hypothetical protein